MQQELLVILFTLTPIFELRGSIPYGILGAGLDPLLVYVLAVCTNILLGIFVFYCFDHVMQYFLKLKWFAKLYNKYVTKTRKKIQKLVDRFGWVGVGLFIGIPLPLSGVYTGAFGAYLLGIPQKKFMIANIVGVFIAATLVTLIVLSGSEIFSIFLNNKLIE